jgi:hypothetical protein
MVIEGPSREVDFEVRLNDKKIWAIWKAGRRRQAEEIEVLRPKGRNVLYIFKNKKLVWFISSKEGEMLRDEVIDINKGQSMHTLSV